MKVDKNSLERYQLGRNLQVKSSSINSLDFSDDGTVLVAGCSAEENAIKILRIDSLEKESTLYSKKYGVSEVTFTHNSSTIVIAPSDKNDITVRLWNIAQNRFERYFKGHAREVTCIDFHPQEDCFLTSAADNTIRLWDIRVAPSVAVIRTPAMSEVTPLGSASRSGAVAKWDPTGVSVLMLTASGRMVVLDRRSMQPVKIFNYDDSAQHTYRSFSISADGARGILNHSSGVEVVDLFNGMKCGGVQVESTGSAPKSSLPLASQFTQNPDFFVVGTPDGRVKMYETERTTNLCVMKAVHESAVTVIKANPIYAMLASGSNADESTSSLKVWVPDEAFE